MLVSHLNEFIFIKTHRSASTSIEVLLQPFCTKDQSLLTGKERQNSISDERGIIGYRGPCANKKLIVFRNYTSISELITQLGLETVNKYFKFCVVRDPWTKLVSAFMDQAKFKNFNDFVRNRIHIYYDWPLYTVDDKPVMDFVIRFDYLKSDLKKALAKVGINTKIINNMQEFKKTKDKRRGLKWKSFFDKNLDEMVQKHFEKEIVNFGFTPPWIKNKE